MNSVTVKIRIASAKDAARPISRTQEGTGRIIMTITAINATAKSTVGRKSPRTVQPEITRTIPAGCRRRTGS